MAKEINIQTPTAFFKSINPKALPGNAGQYLDTDILSDPDLDLIDETDEDYLEIKALIEQNFPQAVGGGAAGVVAPAEPGINNKEPEITKSDYQASLDGAQVALEFEKKGTKTYKSLLDYIGGLEVAIEMS